MEIQEYNSSHSLTSTKWFVGNEERDGSNTTTRRYFAQGEQRIVSGTPTNYFYTRDHLGSIREVMGSNGTTLHQRYDYDPYGRRAKDMASGSNDIDCDFGFTGYYYHATSGLYLSPARAYDPNVGRFISRDPSGESSGLNLYAYCVDNPIDNIDLTGLDPISISDSDLDAEADWIIFLANGGNISGIPVSDMSRADFVEYMTIGLKTNVFGNPNGDTQADTEFHSDPHSFTYTGQDFPGLNGMTFTGQELNYLGVGAVMAAAGESEWLARWETWRWWTTTHTGPVPPEVYAAMEAGWNYYNNKYSRGRFEFPPGSCMDSMPSAFSEQLSVNTHGSKPGSTGGFSF